MVVCGREISLVVFNFTEHSLNTYISTGAHVLSSTQFNCRDQILTLDIQLFRQKCKSVRDNADWYYG